jgi:hypothetical protein
VRRKISAYVDGGLSGGSRVRRPGSEDPRRRERKLRNVPINFLAISRDSKQFSSFPKKILKNRPKIDLKPNAKFRNPTITPGRKVTTSERKRKERKRKIVDT